jgi:hypothetical protein
MEKFKSKIKVAIPIFIYWSVFFIIFFVAMLFGKNGLSDNFDFSGYLGFYLLFFHPFLFFIPYQLTKLKKIINKIIFIIIFLVIPYIVIYIYFSGLNQCFW